MGGGISGLLKSEQWSGNAGLDTQFLRNVTVSPRNATVSVAQNNPSKAADSQRSDLTSELPPAIQPRHPHTNLVDIALHRLRFFVSSLTGKGNSQVSSDLVCLIDRSFSQAGILSRMVAAVKLFK